MARTVDEWIGKTDDSKVPDRVQQRIVDRQDGCCALTSKRFGPGNNPQFDHKVPLWLGGQHRESNLQAICEEEHKAKTAAEAAVRGKVNKVRQKHLGIKKPKGSVKSACFAKVPKAKPARTKSLPPRRRLFERIEP